MNKLHLFYAVAMGSWLAYLVFQSIEPKSERLEFHPNLKGDYVDSLEEDSYRANIKKWPNGVLVVSYEPRTQRAHYFVAIGAAIGFGILFYRNQQWQSKREQERKEEDDGYSPPINYTPHPDPIYEEFLLENSNRRFVPRATLEKEFQAWQEKRDKPDEQEV